jgi:hypothetical protein
MGLRKEDFLIIIMAMVMIMYMVASIKSIQAKTAKANNFFLSV